MKNNFKLLVLSVLSIGTLCGCANLNVGGTSSSGSGKTLFDITFKNYDSSILETKKVEKGIIPSCSVTPTRAADSEYEYSFKGWSPALYAADKNQEYVATYDSFKKETPKYTITFVDFDGTVIQTGDVYQGQLPSCTQPSRESDEYYDYSFSGWDPAVTTASQNQTYTAKYSTKEKVIDGNSYEKITEEPDNWEGEYLIVYENGGVCFDSSLTTLDAKNNTKSAKISSGKIENTKSMKDASVRISECTNGYSILTSSSYYIGGKSGSNGISTSKTSEIANTFSFSNGNLSVKSNGKYLRYNTSNSKFQYSSSGNGIQLYKKIGSSQPIELESISLSETSLEIGQGKAKTLTVAYNPSKVSSSRKGVAWSTSDANVATVSNGEVKVSSTAVAGSKATITATSTYNSAIKATCEVTVTEVQQAAWTIMVYMCGADLESDTKQGGAASSDLSEIKSVAGQPDDVNIIVQTGGCNKWRTSAISGLNASYSQRWHLENKTFVQDSKQSKINMGLSSTFQSFLEWGLTEYPADKTGVILWNHGGAMTGVCFDEQFDNDSLTNQETKLAFENAFTKLGRTEKIEFIGYDACLMGVQDIAEFNSHYANYMVCSQEYEAGSGWDYDGWIGNLYAKKSTETILTSIVDSFITDTNALYRQYGESSDQTLSVLNLSYMEEYKNAWESMSSALYTKLSSSSSLKGTFSTTINKAKQFCVDDEQSEDYYAIYDAKDVLNKIKENSSVNPGNSYINACIEAFDKVVVYSSKGSGAGNANGLCCFFADVKGTYGAYSMLDEVYSTSNTNFTEWRKFNKQYGGYSSASSGGGWY